MSVAIFPTNFRANHFYTEPAGGRTMPARAAACLLAVAAAATVSAPSPCAGFVLLRVDGRAPRLHGAWRRSVGEMPPDAAPLVATRGWHQDPATRARAAGSSLPDLVAPASVGAAEGAGAFAQCCRACSEWRALEPQLGALERQLAAGHARSDVVAAALAAARRVVLRPALLAALELRDWRSGGGGRVRGDESMQAGYEAAVLLWSREGWEQARDLLQQEADPPPTADLVRHFRATMRAVVGDVEDSYVETFTPAQEALPQGEGARYRAQAVTVDLSSAPVPDPAGASSLRQFFRVARDLLTGKVRKREWLRSALAGLLTRALSRRTAAPQLAVDMRSPAADAPVGAAEDVQLGASVVGVVGAVGAGGEDSVSSVGLGHAAMPAPAATELVEDELPELLIVPQRNGILSYDTRDPEQAAAAMAAVRRCNQPVVLKHVGQAQGWRALQSWTLQRLASEFAPAPPPLANSATSAAAAPLVNVRLAGSPNILQCNRQHPLIRNGQFVPPSQTRQMPVSEYLARIRADRGAGGLESLLYGHDERLYLQSHAYTLSQKSVPCYFL